MKNIKTLLGLIAIASLAAPNALASWATASVRYSCDVQFQVSGKSVFLALGYTHADGTGQITCTDYKENQTVQIPIRAQLKGPGAGLGVQEFTLDGGIAKALVESSPESLLGEYVNASVSGAVGVGAGVNTGGRLSLNKGAFVMNLSVSGQRGLGANISVFSIRLDPSGPTTYTKIDGSTPAKVAVSAPTPPEIVRIPARRGQTIVILNEDGKEVSRFLVKEARKSE